MAVSDTPHGRKARRAQLRRLDETVVENAMRQRDAAQLDATNARAEAAELEGELTQWKTRANELAGVIERIVNNPTSDREDVQAILNVTLGKITWR